MDEELKQLAAEYLEENYPDLISIDPKTSQRLSENIDIEKLEEDRIQVTISDTDTFVHLSISLYEGELEIECSCADYGNNGKCVHTAFLLKEICEGTFNIFLPEKEKGEPELIGPNKVIEIAREDPVTFVNCLAQSHAYLLTNLAMVIKDREHLYRELEYLESAIQAATSSRKVPSSSTLHSWYNLALDLSEMIYQFDDIDYERLIPLQAQMIRAGVFYRDRCLRHNDPFYMNLDRMLYLACQNTKYVEPKKRYEVINSWISMVDEDIIPFLFADILSVLSEADKGNLGKRLAELNMKKGAKFFGWKKKPRKR